MMKLTGALMGLAALLGSTAAAAETDHDARAPREQPWRYQLAPHFGVTKLKGSVFAPNVGMRAMTGTPWETFNIGLGVTGMRFDEANGWRGLQHAWYGTLVLEWTLLRQARLHPVIDFGVGAGKQYWLGRAWNRPGNTEFIVVEPSIGVEADVSRFMRLRLAMVARGALSNQGHLGSDELSGVGGRLSLSFGRF